MSCEGLFPRGPAANIGALFPTFGSGAFYQGGLVHHHQAAQAGAIGFLSLATTAVTRQVLTRPRSGSVGEKRGRGRVRALGQRGERGWGVWELEQIVAACFHDDAGLFAAGRFPLLIDDRAGDRSTGAGRPQTEYAHCIADKLRVQSEGSGQGSGVLREPAVQVVRKASGVLL
jgi:hypothetical protein